jgi:hypothetical protein
MSESTARRAGTDPKTGSRRDFLRRTVAGSLAAAASSLVTGSARAGENPARPSAADGRTRRIERVVRRYGPEFGGGTPR